MYVSKKTLTENIHHGNETCNKEVSDGTAIQHLPLATNEFVTVFEV